MYLSYFLYANRNGFPYLGSRYCFSSKLYSLFWRDHDIVSDRKYRYHPMAAIGRWVYGLVKCHGRERSDHSQLYHSCSDDNDLLPRSSEQRCLYPS